MKIYDIFWLHFVVPDFVTAQKMNILSDKRPARPQRGHGQNQIECITPPHSAFLLARSLRDTAFRFLGRLGACVLHTCHVCASY